MNVLISTKTHTLIFLISLKTRMTSHNIQYGQLRAHFLEGRKKDQGGHD